MKVLVTGLFTQAGIFAIRRFGQLGFEVTAADNHRLAFGLYSRYVSRRLILPSLRRDPEGYAIRLLDELASGNYDYYFPAFEESYLLSRYARLMDRMVKHTLPSTDVLANLHDKARLSTIAQMAGVNYPETLVPQSLDDLDELIKHIDYPVFIKIRRARNSIGLRLVKEPSKIRQAYMDVMRRNLLSEAADELPIIQRKINGREVASLELGQEGTVVGEMFHAGLRFIPRSGGTSTSRVAKWDEACCEASTKIIRQVGWSGFICFDYIVEEKSGKVYVIDCNPRPTVSLKLSFDAGVDMIPEWIKIADKTQSRRLPRPREECKTSTLFADLIWYMSTYIKGPESWKERAELRRRWRQDRQGMHYDIEDRRDWLPTLFLYMFLLVQAIKLLFTNLEAANLYLYYNSYDANLADGDLNEAALVTEVKRYPSKKEKVWGGAAQAQAPASTPVPPVATTHSYQLQSKTDQFPNLNPFLEEMEDPRREESKPHPRLYI